MLIREAKLEVVSRYVGIPFKWGGADLQGTDCIGIVVMFLQDCGVDVVGVNGQVYEKDWWKSDPQRFIREILERGDEVGRDDLCPYDVLCFQIGDVIRHIGVYVGYGKFLHAYTDASAIDRLSGGWGGRLVLCVRPKTLR